MPTVASVLVAMAVACTDNGSDVGVWVEADAEDLRQSATLQLEIDADFGNVVAVAADAQGRIYAADGMANTIQVFDLAGDFLFSLGGEGQGPGEFQGLRDLKLARSDTIFAFDFQLNRITAWTVNAASEPTLEYTVDLTTGDGMAPKSSSFFAFPTGGWAVQFTEVLTGEELYAERNVALRSVTDADGVSGAAILEVSDRDILVSEDPRYGFAAGEMPYGREPLLREGAGGHIYYARTDSTAVNMFDDSGSHIRRIDLGRELSTSEVTRGNMERLLDSYGDGIPRTVVSNAYDEGQIPSTKPLLRTFVVDDQRRVWVRPVGIGDLQLVEPWIGLVYHNEGGAAQEARWIVVDDSGGRIGVVEMPANVDVQFIREGTIYGTSRDDLGVFRVVRYQIIEKLFDAQ